MSFSSNSSSKDIVNSTETRTGPIFRAPSLDNYHNWNISRIDIDTIYKIGAFNFMRAYSIRTHEEAISLQNGLQTLPTIKQNAIEHHLKADYRFMHIGLVQVAVKPLLRKGVNTPFFMVQRDKRLKKYKSSLLAVIQTNVSKGPTFFNCFPDFTVDLTCPLTTETLKLDVHV